MKRFIVILLVLVLVGGGGAGGLIMMGVVPNPFNPDAAALFENMEEADAGGTRDFEPPSSALQLVRVNDMIVPVIIEGRLVRRVMMNARLVVSSAGEKSLVEDTLPIFQDRLVKELVPYFQNHFRNNDIIDIRDLKRFLKIQAEAVYGDVVIAVLLTNAFQQKVR